MKLTSLALAAALLATGATGALASASCFVGASAGTTVTATQIDDGATRIDAGATGIQGGPEVGCTFMLDSKFSLGALARYDFSNLRAAVDGATLKSNGRWMVGGTVGYALNPGVNVYGLLGIAGTELRVPTIDTAKALGLVGGLGINLDIGQGPLSAFLEVNHIMFKSEDIGTINVKPSESVVRAGVRFSVGK